MARNEIIVEHKIYLYNDGQLVGTAMEPSRKRALEFAEDFYRDHKYMRPSYQIWRGNKIVLRTDNT